MFIEGFLGYECILLELFGTPVPGLIGITLTTRSQNCLIFMQCQNLKVYFQIFLRYTRMYRRSFGENFKLQTIGLKTHMLSVSFSLALQLALRRKEGIPDISRKFSFSMTHPDS